MRQTLDKTRNTCDIFQRNGEKPHRFRVSIPDEECVFNQPVGLDLMEIRGKTVLDIVDRDTKFFAATFLRRESTTDVWNAFVLKWVVVNIGYSDTVVLDQGPQFQSKEFVSLLMATGLGCKDAGVASHNSVGKVERYYAYFRNIFEKACGEHPNLSENLVLKLAVQASNYTAGTSGLVPTLLVLGIMPRIPVHPRDLPGQKE